MATPMEECVDERNVVVASPLRVRVVVLVVGAASLVVLAPVIREVYASLGTTRHAHLLWVLAAVCCTAIGLASSWALQRLALRVTRWSDVVGPHLAGNAASNLLPVGSAFGSVVQLRMLMRNRIDLTRAVTSLTITSMLSMLTGLFVFPLLILLPIGGPTDPGVDSVSRFGVVALLLVLPIVAIVLRTDRPMRWVAGAVHDTLRRIPRCRPPADLAERIVTERDGVRVVLGRHKPFTMATCVGRTLGDYLALYASLLAVGLRPSPATVLVAFVAANAAGMIPLTPGGLGFVEAGLAATLVVTGAAESQALAAVAIYRLVSCWLPVLLGVGAYVWSRRARPVTSAANAAPLPARAAGVAAVVRAA